MKSFIRSFAYALNGLKNCLLKETNFKIHIFCFLLVITCSWYFKISAIEWICVLLSSALVMSMEMLNTAVEKLCNVVHKEMHPGIKIIKDIAAGAVLLSAIIAAICGAIIFIPKILLLSNSINLS